MSVQAQIKYYLSELGRRDSLRKGGDGRQLQTVTGVVADAELDSFSVSEGGEVSFDAVTNFGFGQFSAPKGAQWVENSNNVTELHWDVVPTLEELLTLARCRMRAEDEFVEHHLERDALEGTA